MAAYAGTPEGSPLRRCLVEIYAARMTIHWDFREGSYPVAFTMDLLRAMVKQRTVDDTKFYPRRETWFKM